MRVAIIGAGAIGRGVLAPLFMEGGCSIGLIDKDSALVRGLARDGAFSVMTVREGTCKGQTYRAEAYMVPEEASEYVASADAMAVCVGVDAAPEAVRALKSPPVVLCFENDIGLAAEFARLLPGARIGFGVPDVIAYSEVASEDAVARVVVDQGPIHVSDVGLGLASIDWCDDIDYYWNRKAFLHNTPHAVLAFVSNMLKIAHVPDAMAVAGVRAIVDEALRELTAAVSAQGLVPAESAARYAQQESRRLQEPLVRDSIGRIARCPERKLGKRERFFRAIDLICSADGNPFTVELGAACCVLAVTRATAGAPLTEESCRASIARYSGLPEGAPACQRVGELAEALAEGASPLSLLADRPPEADKPRGE